MKYLLLILLLLVNSCSGIEKKYQSDMDRVRMSHIDYLNTLILEYQAKSGRFPLQSEIKDKDIHVFITHRKIPDWLQEQTKQLPLESYSSIQLETDIEKILGRDIQMPSDPQNVATYAPNLYIYHVTKSWACVAGHLYSPTPRTKNINNQYYKYELCNNKSTTSQAYDGFIKNLDLNSDEIYIRLYPADGYLYIKEYNISTLKFNDNDIDKQINNITRLVQAAEFSVNRFGFEIFEAQEERIFIDRDFVTGEYHLLTKETDLRNIMEDCYGKILNREVVITIEEKSIGLHYSGLDLSVADNNSLGVYGKGIQNVIFWENGSKFYEAVFTVKKDGTAFNSIVEFLDNDISSPIKSESEIMEWRSHN